MNSLPLLLALAFAVPPAAAQTLEQLGGAKSFLKAAAAAPSAPLAQAGPQAPPPPELPARFDVVEKVISLTNSFTLKADGRKLGDVTERILSWTRAFDYRDANGNELAKAHEKLLSWGTQIVVEDAQGRKIGEIREKVMKSLFKVTTEYAVLDGQGRTALTSRKTDWITTDFALYDGGGRLVATMHRPWLNLFSDHWSVELKDPKAVDARVLVMIVAYKTAVDNDRRAQEDKKSRDDKKDDD